MMPCRRLSLTLIVAGWIATAGGCGYLSSGRWVDDPENWSRAFHTKKPADVVVVHSYYWRSPHWSWEGGYYFEIAPNPEFLRELLSQNRLQAVETAPTFEAPEWFAPKPLSAYRIWAYEDEPRGNFRVLVDQETGTVFLSDHQV